MSEPQASLSPAFRAALHDFAFRAVRTCYADSLLLYVLTSRVVAAGNELAIAPKLLDQVAAALMDLDRQIPADLPWVLRVDGHTDSRPITSPQFPSNWELSAGRAISVVQYLISKGVSAQRLVAAGFGEFQPIDPAKTIIRVDLRHYQWTPEVWKRILTEYPYKATLPGETARVPGASEGATGSGVAHQMKSFRPSRRVKAPG